MVTGPTSCGRWTSVTGLFFILQLFVIAHAGKGDDDLLTNFKKINSYWSNLRQYEDVPENNFGVEDVGLPEGCKVVQVQGLHRHAARYPSSVENALIVAFATKIVSKPANSSFTGSLSFLNTWTIRIGADLLLPAGVSMAHTSGTTFWTDYGRLLYNASAGQPGYVSTNQTNPLIRCHTLQRVYDTAYAWADGFFGEYNATSKYSLLAIPFSPGVNNTLASFLSCANFANHTSSLTLNQPSFTAIIPLYLGPAQKRLSQYAPSQINFTTEDIFAMQALCTYETFALGSSEFCPLFTTAEWEGFEYVYDSFMYNVAAFGSPAGRALGIGVVQEMLARLNKEYITSSDSSVNSTLDSSPITFPLDQKFNFDFTNDFIILGVLTALSIDYFRSPLPLSYPPPKDRRFRLSQLVPYAGRLITERITCTSRKPVPRREPVTEYTSDEYVSPSATSSHDFIRMRLNNGILPLNTIRGGACNIKKRTDGLCPLGRFIKSQADATKLANYQFVCFGNYTYNSTYFNGDGTYMPPS